MQSGHQLVFCILQPVGPSAMLAEKVGLVFEDWRSARRQNTQERQVCRR